MKIITHSKKPILGNKAKNLIKLGNLTPEFIIIAADIFKEHIYQNDELKNIISANNFLNDYDAWKQLSEKLIHSRLNQKILSYIKEQVPVVTKLTVRSSSPLEDGNKYSFAGIFDSFLDVTVDNIEINILNVWASQFSERAYNYLKRSSVKYSLNDIFLAIIIQKQITPQIGGVIFYNKTIDLMLVTYSSNTTDVQQGVGIPQRLLIHNSLILEKTNPFDNINIVKFKKILCLKRFGTLLDIEFGYDNDLKILQVRKITNNQVLKHSLSFIFANFDMRSITPKEVISIFNKLGINLFKSDWKLTTPVSQKKFFKQIQRNNESLLNLKKIDFKKYFDNIHLDKKVFDLVSNYNKLKNSQDLENIYHLSKLFYLQYRLGEKIMRLYIANLCNYFSSILNKNDFEIFMKSQLTSNSTITFLRNTKNGSVQKKLNSNLITLDIGRQSILKKLSKKDRQLADYYYEFVWLLDYNNNQINEKTKSLVLPERSTDEGDFVPNLDSILAPSIKSHFLTQNDHLSGMMASQGNFEGIVHIIKSKVDLKKITNQSVFVSTDTRPEYIATMLNSKGIICESESFVSHASITCRELGIPCVINVKNATKQLKDGDFITVKNGIITHINDYPKTKKTVIFMGYECNNNCIFCSNSEKREICGFNTKQVQKEILKARKNGSTYLELIGGEPTIRKDIFKIVRFAKKTGFETIMFATNGRMFAIKKFAKKILVAGVNHIVFSIHGNNAKLHDALTQSKGSFNQLIKGIKNLQGLGFKNIGSNTTIIKQNYKQLQKIGKLIYSLGITNSEFIFVDPTQGALKADFNQIVPTYEDVSSYVNNILDFAETKRLKDWRIRYYPLCYLPEKHHKRTSELLESQKFKSEHIGVDLFNLDAQEARKEIGRTKLKKCFSCKQAQLCEGYWKEYVLNHYNKLMVDSPIIPDLSIFPYSNKKYVDLSANIKNFVVKRFIIKVKDLTNMFYHPCSCLDNNFFEFTNTINTPSKFKVIVYFCKHNNNCLISLLNDLGSLFNYNINEEVEQLMRLLPFVYKFCIGINVHDEFNYSVRIYLAFDKYNRDLANKILQKVWSKPLPLDSFAIEFSSTQGVFFKYYYKANMDLIYADKQYFNSKAIYQAKQFFDIIKQKDTNLVVCYKFENKNTPTLSLYVRPTSETVGILKDRFKLPKKIKSVNYKWIGISLNKMDFNLKYYYELD